jgi:anaphase-promoting complex subunit 3
MTHRGKKKPAMYAALANCVQYSLENFLYDNATFMAERIWAEDKSELSRHLLATCYFSSQKFYAAFDVLRGSTSERNKYLLALSAFRLGKLKEAEYALTEGQPITNICVPNNGVGLHLLGTICR